MNCKKEIIVGEVVRRYPAPYDKSFIDIIERTHEETAGI